MAPVGQPFFDGVTTFLAIDKQQTSVWPKRHGGKNGFSRVENWITRQKDLNMIGTTQRALLIGL